MRTDKLKSSLEKLNFWFFSSSFFTTDLKYAYALAVLIPHIVQMTYFDYILSILQNFKKTKCANELHSSSLQSNCFLKVLEN